MYPGRIQEEKQKLLDAHQAYLAQRPPVEEVMPKTREGIDTLNALDDLEATYMLTMLARRYDIEPAEDSNYWRIIEAYNERALTPTGRNAVRKLIDDEKIRRRQAKTSLWTTVIIPTITAIAGLIGITTGLVVALRK